MAWIVSSRAIVQPGGTRKRSTEEENQGEKSAEYEENGVGNTKIRPDSAAPSRKTEKRNQTKIYPFSSLFLHQTPSLPHPRDTGSRENYPRRSSHTDHLHNHMGLFLILNSIGSSSGPEYVFFHDTHKTPHSLAGKHSLHPALAPPHPRCFAHNSRLQHSPEKRAHMTKKQGTHSP